ncbi:sodium-dependent nutrient amino acid transporter 1-like [Schistocerca nitens]|uniref:sodium-dependent nutrient amino acid transporter 1-like n=1 Tax=Schistocerca nitens TaxID=7011 RepID=UPI0021193AE3|nr:sodium-dependent nutrient amino acid transporter 1-like [Schistocerca nitens]
MPSMKNKYNVTPETVELGNVNPAYVSDNAETNGRKLSVASDNSAKVGEPPVTGPETTEGDESERAQWSNGVEFLMSCIAMSVGLGNVWRFPYTAYKNGGGAFLIPYIIVLLVIGKPLYYMEMAMGQFSSYGPIKVWNMAPALTGLGFGQFLATALLLTYYCAIMALTVYYFVASFHAELPWAHCYPELGELCFDSAGPHDNATNITGRLSSSTLYLQRLLNEVSTLDEGIGAPDWRLTLCLLFSWVVVFLVVVRGVKSSGKAAYFLALFPYVVLFALLIRGVTLPGAGEGILYFIRPQWELLLTAEVWYEAVTQAFFSLGVSFGTLIMYSSYNGFSHNIHRDAIIVTTMDTFTSLLAGCTIFAILGNLKYETNAADIDAVAKKGAELAFVSYPEAIAKFDFVPQLFSVLFFLMLFTLGIGSAVALEAAVMTIICDQFPKIKHWIIALVTCSLGFLAGLVYITPGGQWILTLVDFYGVQFVVFILATIEMIAIAWIYGVDNFCQDIEFMLNVKVSFYWRICWGFVTPVMLFVILLYTLINMESPQYHDMDFPASAYGAGWAIFLFAVLQVPFSVAYQFVKNRHLPLKQMIVKSFTPSTEWGPRKAKELEEWKKFKANRLQENELSNDSFWKKLLHKLTGCRSSSDNNM